MSNAERQKRFQAAHPGYDARRKARERGMAKRATERARAALRAQAAAGADRPVLTLPAPVEDPMMAQVNALDAAPPSKRATQPVARQASDRSERAMSS